MSVVVLFLFTLSQPPTPLRQKLLSRRYSENERGRSGIRTFSQNPTVNDDTDERLAELYHQPSISQDEGARSDHEAVNLTQFEVRT